MAIAGKAKSHLTRHPKRCTASMLLMLTSFLSALAVADGHSSSAQEGTGLEVHLIVTAGGRELFNSWDNPDGKPFEIVPVKIAPRDKFLSAVVLFKGCKADVSGNCNVEIDIVAYDPTGKIYGELKGAELWQHRPAPAPGHTQLGVAYMGLEIEPRDPAGAYRVEAVARDLNAGVEARSATQFEVE
jgi:hypothetical protein